MNFRDLVPWPRGERDRDSQSMLPVATLHRDVNRLFEEAFRGFGDSPPFGGRTYSERFYGRFERQISLDRDVDDSAVKATFKQGILTIAVPKNAKAAERTKRIPISIGKAD